MLFWIACFSTILLCSGFSAGAESLVPGDTAPVPIEEGWSYRWADSAAELRDDSDCQWYPLPHFPSRIAGRNGRSYLALKVPLPQKNYSYPSIYLERVYLLTEILLDGKVIYSHGDLEASVSECFQGLDWHLASLPPDYAGKTMLFLFRSDYNVIGLKHSVMLGNRSDHVRNIVRSDVPRVVCATIFFFIGGIALFLSLVRHYRIRGLFGFCALSFGAAIHTIYYSSVKTLVVKAPLFWNYAWLFSTAVMIVGGIELLRMLFANRPSKLLRPLVYVHLGYAIAAALAFALKRYDLAPLLDAGRLALYAAEFSVALSVLAVALHRESRYARVIGLGMLGLAGAMALDFLAASQSIPYYRFGTHWGLLCAIASFGFVFADQLSKTVKIANAYKKEFAQLREKERRLIYADLHDHIGGKLNDLLLLAERGAEADFEARSLLKDFADGLRSGLTMLRERLSTLEDLETLSRDFVLGAQLSLIRRYSAAGRKVRIEISEELRFLLKNREFGSSAGTLHATLMELATNDLKYGLGMSEWRFFLVDGEPFRIGIRLCARTEYARSPADGGRGRRTIAERIEDLDGRIVEGPSIDAEGHFLFHFEVPLSVS